MPDTAPIPPTGAEPAPVAVVPARPPSLAGRLLAPVRYARRHPLRALLRTVLGLAVLAALVAGGTYLWFRYHLGAAREAVDRGHNAEAVDHLMACRKVWDDHPGVRLMMARVARRAGQMEDAERLLDDYWARHGDDEALVFERLLLRAARGELEVAGPPLLARAQADGPDAGPALEALVTGYLVRYRWGDAIRTLDEWLGRHPDDTTALLLKGKLQEQRLDPEGPAVAYRRILELDPDHDEARLRLATVLLQRFYGEEALPHLEFLRTRLPDNPEVAYQWAVALGLQGRTDEARAALDDLLRTRPHHAAALAARGRYAVQAGDEAAALDYLTRAVRLDPGNTAVRHQYAQALTRAGRAAEAAREQQVVDRMRGDMERMNQLIAGPLQTTPNDPDVHHQIASIALRSGQPAEGVRWLQSALQVDPNHLPSHNALIGYYQATGNPILAARHRAIASQLTGGR
jgi:tetratricopeptide (TPR) repeat protein